MFETNAVNSCKLRDAKSGRYGRYISAIFLAGANFWAILAIFCQFWVIFGLFWVILGHFWAILAVLGHFWAILGNFRSFFGANFLWQNMPLCYLNHFLQL